MDSYDTWAKEARIEWEACQESHPRCCNCGAVDNLEELAVNFYTGLGEEYHLCCKCGDAYGPAMQFFREMGITRAQLDELAAGGTP